MQTIMCEVSPSPTDNFLKTTKRDGEETNTCNNQESYEAHDFSQYVI